MKIEIEDFKSVIEWSKQNINQLGMEWSEWMSEAWGLIAFEMMYRIEKRREYKI